MVNVTNVGLFRSHFWILGGTFTLIHCIRFYNVYLYLLRWHADFRGLL